MKIFETVAEMKLAHLATGQIVKTKGYYAAGDGGDADYLIEAANSPDGYGDHALAGGTQATLQSQGREIALQQYGASTDTTVDSSGALDAFLVKAWAGIPEYYSLTLPSQCRLDKAGDFVAPPNVAISGQNGKSVIYLGNSLTRLFFKRDNAAVPAEYQEDGAYWGLGPNQLNDIEFALADGVASNAVPIFVSDLINFRTRNVVSTVSEVGIQFENDAKWTEFIDLEGRFSGTIAGIKFTRTVGSGFASFGHSRFACTCSARGPGVAAVLVQDGASVYNSNWKMRGFLSTDAGQEAYLFKLEDSGSDINYASVDWTVENLGNAGTVYGIHAPAFDVSYVDALFHGIGADTKFRGVSRSSNVRSIGGDIIDSAGAAVFQGNLNFKVATGQADVNGDNLMRFAQEKAIHYQQSGAVTANSVLGILPVPLNKVRICSVQIYAGTASSGNTGAEWYLGIRKAGSTNPSKVVALPDGQTKVYSDIFYELPSAWGGLPDNTLVWRNTDGTGNDGTGPSDVFVVLKYYEI